MKIFYCLLTILLVLQSCNTTKNIKNTDVSPVPNLEKVGETEGLSHVESFIFDQKNNRLIATTMADKETGDGGLATLSLDGKILNANFTTGLDDPKGMVIVGDKLYTADNDHFAVIDLNTGKILKREPVEGAQGLNDVTIDDQGDIYVSDTGKSAIFKMNADETLTEWYNSSKLEKPNGILAVGDSLYLGGWGISTPEEPQDKPIGRFLKINKETKEITRVTKLPLGKLDGIQQDGKGGFLVSDWGGGKIYLIKEDGKTTQLLEPGESVGDILYILKTNMLYLPMNKQNKLLVYKLVYR